MDFTADWSIMQTLGEGAYGEVKLLINKNDGMAVAMKVINLEEHPEASVNVQKEIAIHRMLNDPHIIKYFGQRTEGSVGYIFLEYAPGGELFDKIEPDVGMESWQAQRYLKQLLSGVEYLHSKGIAHRDLKPENLLLDEHDKLKITDFGMATVFRSRGKERLLDKKCGTTPYMAPEIFLRPYRAEPVDIWSLGIVLVAMLAGELPWEKPMALCVEYTKWKSNDYMSESPWKKMDNLAISLLRRILNPIPSARLSIAKIKQHRWYTKHHTQIRGPELDRSVSPAYKRLRSNDLSPPSRDDPRQCQSQPELLLSGPHIISPTGTKEPAHVSFSQPAQIDDLLVSTQYLATQSNASQDTVQKLVRRMTRFFVSLDPDKALDRLVQALDNMALSWRSYTPGIVTITTIDKHKNQLTFKASVLDMDKQTLLDFRLSKGCGLEFKRQFMMLRKYLSDIVVKGPVSWSIAIATNNVP
ncbi:serine/threonine-protein kinase grp [Homalodisca vitripennis]|uniref:non-specific serine/threonine protein kinase n=2 Tax=Homalodisca liturata TaxID=320908 RepID=A0A1B6ILR0_9HEMI|nr:serine/threonine-protein kinase grp [Homalodisca vitripennis]